MAPSPQLPGVVAEVPTQISLSQSSGETQGESTEPSPHCPTNVESGTRHENPLSHWLESLQYALPVPGWHARRPSSDTATHEPSTQSSSPTQGELAPPVTQSPVIAPSACRQRPPLQSLSVLHGA
jgi:hypothetical protein